MRTWLLLATLALWPGMAIAQTDTQPAVARPERTSNMSPANLATIVQAVGKGDVPTLAKLYRHLPDPVTRVLAAMALKRIHFNLGKATADARVCERSLLDSQPRIAFFCAEFANGDIRLAHGEQAADRDEQDMVQRFAGHVPPARLDGLRHYVASRRNTPSMQIQRPTGTFVIALGRKPYTDMQTITITANGAHLPLIVDTGSSNITIDATWAHKLGVRMTDRAGVTSGFLSRRIRVRHGVLDQVDFAGVHMTHVPVEVVPGKQRLIGIGVLRHLGSLRLSKGKITVYGNPATLPVRRQPMLIASDVWGHHLRLLTAVWVNGHLYTPLVDSGSSGFLYASQTAMSMLKSGDNTRLILHGVGPRPHHTRTNWASVDVRIGKQAFDLTLPIFKDARLPWKFLLGSGALDYMDFYFGFNTHHTPHLHADARIFHYS